MNNQNNISIFTLEYTYSSNTHLVTSSGVQLELINCKLHNFSLACQSCLMQHSPSKVVSVVEQKWNLPRKIDDGVSMATLCSIVQGIAPILQKWNAYRMYDSEAARHVPPHPN